MNTFDVQPAARPAPARLCRLFGLPALVLACCTLIPAPCRAQSEHPYELTILLKFSEAPLLTPFFRRSLARQVKDQLANYFGSLANVRVETEKHWLLDALQGHDIDEQFVTSETLAQRQAPEKTFVVVVDHDGLYRVRWRQIDGLRRLVCPVRERTTPDRQWVGKAVCLAVKDDFAPVATVKKVPGSRDQVDLEFRGSQHYDQLGRWLGEDCILQPYWVVRQRSGPSLRVPIPNTVLRMKRRQGRTQAVVVSNLTDPLRPRARVTGFEAVRISTCAGRLRLRVVDAETGGPALNCLVYANDRGFDQLGDEDGLGDPDPNGYVLSRRSFSNLAYIRIAQGGSVVRIPLPITDPLCRLQCQIRVDPEAGEKSAVQRELRFLSQDLQVLQLLINDVVTETNTLNEGKRYEEALQKVKSGLQSVSPLCETAGATYGEIQSRARKLQMDSNSMLKWAGDELQDVKQRTGELSHLGDSLQQTIDKITAQGQANVLIELGVQFEKDGDAEEAIARYTLALKEQPDQPKLKERLEKLQEAWRIKSPQHKAARDLVYQRWAQTQVDQIEKVLPEAVAAFQTLKSAGDTPSARKLVKINGQKMSDLNDLIEILAAREDKSDLADHEKYVKLVQRLLAFQKSVTEYLSGASSQPSAAPSPAPGGTSTPAGPSTPAPPQPTTTPPSAEEEEEPLK